MRPKITSIPIIGSVTVVIVSFVIIFNPFYRCLTLGNIALPAKVS
ncbi:hypothetical protein [Limosilactobacillus reuteri]|nr:hypothetical protein [Limosilactobacillus reuteri]